MAELFEVVETEEEAWGKVHEYVEAFAKLHIDWWSVYPEPLPLRPHVKRREWGVYVKPRTQPKE